MTKLYYESASPHVMETTEAALMKLNRFTKSFVKVSIGYYDYTSSTYYTYDKKIADKFVEYWRKTYEEREHIEYPVEFNINDSIKIFLANPPTTFNNYITVIKYLIMASVKKYILRRKV